MSKNDICRLIVQADVKLQSSLTSMLDVGLRSDRIIPAVRVTDSR
jgi:hypothetical protein